MKQMTKRELTSLGKDLKEAKMTVLHMHGFSCSEIAIIMDIPESVVRGFIDTLENNK